jgi:hypothetical protein
MRLRRPPPTPAPTYPLPPLPDRERNLPKKGSLSTLRSVLSKKGSSTSLRHPFIGTGPTTDCQAPPVPGLPVPRYHDDLPGCLPTTPRHRTPKSSIGNPQPFTSTSPSTFLKALPRRAPGTPKKVDGEWVYEDPVVEAEVQVAESRGTSIDQSIDDSMATDESVAYGIYTPASHAHVHPAMYTPMSPGLSPAKPVLQIPADKENRPRLLNLLPRQKLNLGLQTPPSTGLRGARIMRSAATPLKTNGLPTPSPSPHTRLLGAHAKTPS